VGRDAEQIDVERLHVDLDVGQGLHRVAVQQWLAGPAQCFLRDPR
jgi:hypothetical protein